MLLFQLNDDQSMFHFIHLLDLLDMGDETIARAVMKFPVAGGGITPSGKNPVYKILVFEKGKEAQQRNPPNNFRVSGARPRRRIIELLENRRI